MKICVYCGGELGNGDDPDPPDGLPKHENVRACIVVLRTRLDWMQYNGPHVKPLNGRPSP